MGIITITSLIGLILLFGPNYRKLSNMKPNAKYLVISKKNHTIKDATSAGEVAKFLHGRKMEDWIVYQEQKNLPDDEISMESALLRTESCQSK